MRNKQRYCGQLQNHVWIANFRGRSREITIPSKYSYFFMVLWHGWSCKEVCGTILWVGEQDDSATLQSIYSMHRWPPLQRRRNKICWRIVKSMLSNCSKMLKLGTYWKTWYSMVSEQTCTINHKMDQGLWQTPESIDFIYSSYLWIQTILSCGKYWQTMQTGTVRMVTHLPDFCGKTIWKSAIGTRMGEEYHMGDGYLCIESKVYSCRYTWLITNGWKETKPQSCVEEIDEVGWSGRADTISWPCILGMHSTCMQIQRKSFWRTQKRCSNQESPPEQLKKLPGSTKNGANVIAWSHDMEGHA